MCGGAVRKIEVDDSCDTGDECLAAEAQCRAGTCQCRDDYYNNNGQCGKIDVIFNLLLRRHPLVRAFDFRSFVRDLIVFARAHFRIRCSEAAAVRTVFVVV